MLEGEIPWALGAQGFGVGGSSRPCGLWSPVLLWVSGVGHPPVGGPDCEHGWP